MTLADFCEYCQALPGVEGTTHFGPEVLVYKVGGKTFALAVPEELPHRVNLKCDPERAVELCASSKRARSKLWPGSVTPATTPAATTCADW